MSESQIAYVLTHILNGLAFLHSRNCIHRDIKGDNVLLNLNGDVKLADLGLCASLKEGENERVTVAGSRFWMAPEMINRKPYNYQVDIWSLGALTYEMCHGYPPYHNFRSIKALFTTATVGAAPMRNPDKWSSLLKDIMYQMMRFDPTTRPTAQILCQHNFLSKACPKKKLVQAIEIVFLGNSLRMNGF